MQSHQLVFLSNRYCGEAESPDKKQINVIFMFLQGACQLDMYDMKPQAPSEIRGLISSRALQSLDFISVINYPYWLNTQISSLLFARCIPSSKHGEGDVHIMCGTPVDKNLQGPGIGRRSIPTATAVSSSPPLCPLRRHETSTIFRALGSRVFWDAPTILL